MSDPSSLDREDVPVAFSAADVLAYRWRDGLRPNLPPPDAVVICYQGGPLRHLARRYRGKPIRGFMGDLYLLRNGAASVAALGDFGIGAPATASLVEELAAFGVRRFASIGLAGGLQADLRAGDVLVCDRAVRDEGTSHHYLPPDRPARANPDLAAQLKQALAERNVSFAQGSSWTTDAPYRETRSKVERLRQAGVKTVDMEAAALFAVGEALGLETAALFVVSDSLADLTWRPGADERMIQRRLHTVAEAAVQALSRRT